MIDFGYYNMDCMEGMKQFHDKYFDLAIVDPPYGGVTKGGYMTNQISGGWQGIGMIIICRYGNVKDLRKIILMN